MSQRWKNRPDGSNWGEFGPDDRLGRLNLITAERRRAAFQEAREGLTFSLSLPLNLPGGNVLNPRRLPPVLKATEKDGVAFYNRPFSHEAPGLTDVVCDDAAMLYLQYSTQWDSFCHIGAQFDADGDGKPEIVYYNGFPPPATVGSSALGLEHMAETGVQGRGVLIDVQAKFGEERKAVGYDDLMRIMDVDRIGVEPGDLVCIHTGFAQRLIEMRGKPDERVHKMSAVLDGSDKRLLKWITGSGLACLIADNYAVEERPANTPPGYHGPLLPLHEHCLFKQGIHLGELWHLTPLCEWLKQNGRSRFLLTAPPLRLPGAVGSPANPVATV